MAANKHGLPLARAALSSMGQTSLPACLFSLLHLQAIEAAQLPDDRADIEYHTYSGGDIDRNGPAIFARKRITDNGSISSRYYADSVRNASVDIVSHASAYSERHDVFGLNADYLFQGALMGAGIDLVKEDDRDATSLDVRLEQDVFEGMTTVSMGYTRRRDTLTRVDTDFSADADQHRLRLDIRQIVTRNIAVDGGYEGISSAGYLGDPYGVVRVLGGFVPERTPQSRTGNAIHLGGTVALHSQLSAYASYRYFWDSWEIDAHTFEVGGNFQLNPSLLASGHLRFYNQSAASFYSDNFSQELNYMTRNPQYSEFSDFSVGGEIRYQIQLAGPVQKAAVVASYEYSQFDYGNYTDLVNNDLYGFSANSIQIMFSIWY